MSGLFIVELEKLKTLTQCQDYLGQNLKNSGLWPNVRTIQNRTWKIQDFETQYQHYSRQNLKKSKIWNPMLGLFKRGLENFKTLTQCQDYSL